MPGKNENENIRRVLCIVGSMDRGGAETFLMKIYRELDKRYYQMDFAVNASGVYDDEIKRMGGEIYILPLRTRNPIGCFNKIRKFVKRNKYQLVLKLCNTSIGVIDLYAAKLGGADRLLARSCNSNADIGLVRRFLCALLLPFFNMTTTVKLAPSTEAARFTFGDREVEKKNVVILNNGLKTEDYRYDEDFRAKIRKEIRADNEEIIIGCIGRFTKQKNYKYLIRVFYEFHKSCARTKLILIGEGEMKNQIKEDVSNYGLDKEVLFLGTREDVPELLSAMDIFILTSYYEGMPNVVIEAQTSGLPCVISDKITQEAGITDLVTYLNIDEQENEWSDYIVKRCAMHNIDRKKYADIVKKCGYDISDIVDKFVRVVYGE